MNVCVLFNEKAGSAGQLDAVKASLPAATFVALTPELDIRKLAAGCDVLAVAGGDGTVHAVVNALAPNFPNTPLAVIPLGTGNDLCRTLNVPLDAAEACALIARGQRRRIDVIRVEGDHTGYFVNAATGGFSGKVAADVTPELKQAWGPLAYLRGAMPTVADPPTYPLTIRRDGRSPERITALNVVVANARTAAGGIVVAPRANAEDGKLDLLIVRPGDMLDRAAVTARLLAGDYHADDQVQHHRARVVELTSDEPLPISLDGELTEGRHFTFTVERRALRVIVGRGYRRNPRRLPHRLYGAVAAGLTAGRRVPLAAGLAVALFVGLAVTVSAGWAEPVNRVAREWLNPRADDTLTAFANAMTVIGGGGVLWGVIGLTAIAAAVYRRGLWRFVALALLLIPLELALKWAFGHPRPTGIGAAIAAFEYSFPSGHALRVAAAGTVVAILWARSGRPGRSAMRVACAVVVGVVCWTRLYLDVHWIADVAGGAILGFAAARLAAGHAPTG